VVPILDRSMVIDNPSPSTRKLVIKNLAATFGRNDPTAVVSDQLATEQPLHLTHPAALVLKH
jgi:hypothetical protein